MDSLDDAPVILMADHAEKTAQDVADFLLLSKLSSNKKENQAQVSVRRLAQSSSRVSTIAYTGKKTTLSIAMTSLGIDSSNAFRKQIAVASGISGCMGTASQNTQMYSLLVKKPEMN